MNFGKVKKQGRDLLRVYDEEGSIRSGEEAIEIWRTHFAKVMGGDDGTTRPMAIRWIERRMGHSSVNGCVNQSLERRYYGRSVK